MTRALLLVFSAFLVVTLAWWTFGDVSFRYRGTTLSVPRDDMVLIGAQNLSGPEGSDSLFKFDARPRVNYTLYDKSTFCHRSVVTRWAICGGDLTPIEPRITGDPLSSFDYVDASGEVIATCIAHGMRPGNGICQMPIPLPEQMLAFVFLSENDLRDSRWIQRSIPRQIDDWKNRATKPAWIRLFG